MYMNLKLSVYVRLIYINVYRETSSTCYSLKNLKKRFMQISVSFFIFFLFSLYSTGTQLAFIKKNKRTNDLIRKFKMISLKYRDILNRLRHILYLVTCYTVHLHGIWCVYKYTDYIQCTGKTCNYMCTCSL